MKFFKYSIGLFFTLLFLIACTDGDNSTKPNNITYPQDFVHVDSGTFFMGEEGNQHVVQLDAFYIDKYEVTQQEYQLYDINYLSNDELLPAEDISWLETIMYCNRLSLAEGLNPCYFVDGQGINPDEWLLVQNSVIECNFKANGYRLPTEAEWEFAAREGKHDNDYYYSGSYFIEEVGWYNENSYNQESHSYEVKPQGMKLPNEIGIYDMSGNVAEWCWDYYNSLSDDSQINPTGPITGDSHVLRGGSVRDQAGECTVYHREEGDHFGQFRGIRLVRSDLSSGEVVSKPEISLFISSENEIMTELKSITYGAKIKYSINDEEFVSYSEPFSIDNRVDIRAYSYKNNYINSDTLLFNYRIETGDLGAQIKPTGLGTVVDPMLIRKSNNLLWLSNNESYWTANYFYELINDIDMQVTQLWNDGGGFQTMSTFEANINGNGNKIIGLFSKNGGLISSLKGSLKNIILEDVCLQSSISVGCYARTLYDGLIENCHVSSGTVTSSSSMGGIVEKILGTGSVINCSSSVSFQTMSGFLGYSIGGIAGELSESGRIEQSYFNGDIFTHVQNVGGIVGKNEGEVSNCYSSGTIHQFGNSPSVGGLVGNNSGIIRTSYSLSTITAESKGGLTCSDLGYGTISSYWDTELTGLDWSASGIGKTTSEMKDAATYQNWDFNTIWGLDGNINNGYPYLIELNPQD